MELKYHRAIYDLFTTSKIDPQPYLDKLNEYESVLHFHVPESRLWTKLHLYQRPVRVDSVVVEKLDKWEQRFGFKLPEAFREWYSVDLGLPLLYANTNWWPENLDDMEIRMEDGLPWVVFITEQQDGSLCFLLDGSDDPAVYWWEEEHHPDVPHYMFESIARCFSDFVYCFLWDWLKSYQSKYGCRVQSIPMLPSFILEDKYFVPLEHIRAQFAELPYECFGYHRFQSATQHLRMLPHHEDPNLVGPGDFFADDEQSFRDMIYKIWGQNIPKKRLRPSYAPYQHDESERVIESLT